ncbi:MAG: DUF2271 domain-containing protein [candidate division WOR-3 bacterium]|nr:MAG: DUF2271 domain-containing protein [candidate division WOR-3 bacterium]
MKYFAVLATAFFLLSNLGEGKTLEEYIGEAEEYKNTSQFDKAISTMEQAVEEYSDNSDAYLHLGIMLGEKAQRIRDYMQIFDFVERAFLSWDKALLLNPDNFMARFYRGAWSLNMPKFVGRLENGINDLEIITTALEQSSDPAMREQLMEAYRYLAGGYKKNGEYSKAKGVYEKIIKLVPETEYAEAAREGIDKIKQFEYWREERARLARTDDPMIIDLEEKVTKDPEDFDYLLALGRAYYDNGYYDQAEIMLRRAITIDSSSGEAYRLLAYTVSEISSVDYDPRIYMDTDFRTDLAFETIDLLDKAVTLVPDDIELKLTRAIASIQMPFFVNRIDQGIEELEEIIKSDVSDETRAQALYWLGYAHQKMSTTYWARVVSKYPATSAVEDVFSAFRPPVTHVDLSSYPAPVIGIEFELSYRDELAPQTAVWVENADGRFISTIYVSGFSGKSKEKQINLPVWAKSSEFVDVDAVTGASINLGHHVYVWDLTDHKGAKVKQGQYKVLVEVSYWPSMQYQRVEAPVEIGKREVRKVVEEGDFIPYLEVRYLP